MKRDMDLVRLILLEIEKEPSANAGVEFRFDGYSDEEVSYHVMLLDEAGLIKATNLSAASDNVWFPERLTWEGHEFLEASRDNSRWNKVKEIMAKGGGFVFELAKPILIDLLRKQVSGYIP